MINVLPFFLGPSLTVVVTQFSCIVFPVYMVLRLYRKVRMDVLLPVLIPSLVCTVIATRLSIGMDTGTMKLLLGILFVLLSVYFYFVADRIIPHEIHGRRRRLRQRNTRRPIRCGRTSRCSLHGVRTRRQGRVRCDDTGILSRSQCDESPHACELEGRHTRDLPYTTAAALGAHPGAVIGMKYTTRIKGVLLRRFIYAFVGINGIVMILNEVL